jgi:hypothetical protein
MGDKYMNIFTYDSIKESSPPSPPMMISAKQCLLRRDNLCISLVVPEKQVWEPLAKLCDV